VSPELEPPPLAVEPPPSLPQAVSRAASSSPSAIVLDCLYRMCRMCRMSDLLALLADQRAGETGASVMT
jgi:hypothetical protein